MRKLNITFWIKTKTLLVFLIPGNSENHTQEARKHTKEQRKTLSLWQFSAVLIQQYKRPVMFGIRIIIEVKPGPGFVCLPLGTISPEIVA